MPKDMRQLMQQAQQMFQTISKMLQQMSEMFKTAIGKFEGIEEPLARMGGYTYMMDAARTMTAGAIDLGEKTPVGAGDGTTQERGKQRGFAHKIRLNGKAYSN